MKIQVKLFGNVRIYQPAYSSGQVLHIELPAGATVADLIAKLGIPPGAAVLAMVRGRVQKREFALAEGDEVSLFPPVSGG